MPENYMRSMIELSSTPRDTEIRAMKLASILVKDHRFADWIEGNQKEYEKAKSKTAKMTWLSSFSAFCFQIGRKSVSSPLFDVLAQQERKDLRAPRKILLQ